MGADAAISLRRSASSTSPALSPTLLTAITPSSTWSPFLVRSSPFSPSSTNRADRVLCSHLRTPHLRGLQRQRCCRPPHRRAPRQDHLRRGTCTHDSLTLLNAANASLCRPSLRSVRILGFRLLSAADCSLRRPRPREALHRKRPHHHPQGRHRHGRGTPSSFLRALAHAHPFLTQVHIDYPVGHKRRRAEGTPLLNAKFERHITPHFDAAHVKKCVPFRPSFVRALTCLAGSSTRSRTRSPSRRWTSLRSLTCSSPRLELALVLDYVEDEVTRRDGRLRFAVRESSAGSGSAFCARGLPDLVKSREIHSILPYLGPK